MVFVCHSFLERLPNSHLVLHSATSGCCIQYTPEQVHLYSCFDCAIHLGRLEGTGHLTPAGYTKFHDLWTQDNNSPTSSLGMTLSQACPPLLVLLLTLMTSRPCPCALWCINLMPQAHPPSGDPQYNSRKQSIVDDLILNQLDHSCKAQAASCACQEVKCSRAAATKEDDFGAPACP
ncbi:hypothetical protein C8Q73DRAFT_793743 [Cubamyces lactineus]|nr:hypothetical protein C8Q73DRAFT_793743 [Cubamyces lactineus]